MAVEKAKCVVRKTWRTGSISFGLAPSVGLPVAGKWLDECINPLG